MIDTLSIDLNEIKLRHLPNVITAFSIRFIGFYKIDYSATLNIYIGLHGPMVMQKVDNCVKADVYPAMNSCQPIHNMLKILLIYLLSAVLLFAVKLDFGIITFIETEPDSFKYIFCKSPKYSRS